jgi:hypothetical protein
MEIDEKIKLFRENILIAIETCGFDRKGINAVWANTVSHILMYAAFIPLPSIHLYSIWTSATLALPDIRNGDQLGLLNKFEALYIALKALE